MVSWTRRPAFALLGLVLLAGLGAAMVGEAFIHTDDGCAIEKHCVTCQRVAGSIAIVTPALPPPVALDVLGVVPAPLTLGLFQASRRSAASRGPPRA